MSILFENKTKYTKEVYNTFLEFHNKKYHLPYLLYNIIIIGLILFCIVLQVRYHNLTIAVIFCFILTGFFIWRYLRPANDVRKEYQSDKFKKEQVFIFKFYKSFFTCEYGKQMSKINYFDLYRVFETSDFFYLYIDKTHAFLIDKLCFNDNNSSYDFSNFIHKKCPLRYKNFS